MVGGVGHVGVGCIMVGGWGGSCRVEWGGSCRGGWVMVGWVGWVM